VAPVAATLLLARHARRDVKVIERQFRTERRANELLSQEDSAPRLWAERLAPPNLPDPPGFLTGSAHQAGSGLMTGDILDVFRLPSGHLCCVVGDVAGHGVESSITALQTKFLLRSYLRRFRDPGQALEELNRLMGDFERPEEMVSVCVTVFDEENDTARYASAGHPAAWVVQDRSIRSLRDTGPLLMMDAESTYGSKEIAFAVGDVLVMLTDGLIEARRGPELFGEERLASIIRRDADVEPDVLCKTLLNAAVEFSEGPVVDDVTVMVVRRV
jgi:serine phosphatase RsbU (regulator of sigma subunit)